MKEPYAHMGESMDFAIPSYLGLSGLTKHAFP
jgi:hypothetical protein